MCTFDIIDGTTAHAVRKYIERENPMKKIISLVLCAVIFLGIVAFAGCKSQKENETTSEPSGDTTSAEIAATEATTEQAEQSTAANANATQAPVVKPSVPDETVTNAIVHVPTGDSTQAPSSGSSTAWNTAGNYKCGNGSGMLKPGEYYIVKTSEKYSILLWDGKTKDEQGQSLAYEITINGSHTLIRMESGYELYISGCKFINTEIEHPTATNGKYTPGVYKVGRDIPQGEYVVKKVSKTNYGGFSFKHSVDPYVQNFSNDFNFVDVPIYYTLSKIGSYIIVTSCELTPASNAGDILAPNGGVYSAGMYKVGVDIAPGTYKITPDGSGKTHYAVYTDSTGNDSATKIDLTRISKETNITVAEGEYLYIYNATMKFNKNPNSGLDLDATLPG